MVVAFFVLSLLYAPVRPIPVRDAYQKTAIKALLVIDRSQHDNFDPREINSALDALHIEAQTPEEISAEKVLMKFYGDIVLNGTTHDLILSAVNLAEVVYRGESRAKQEATDQASVSRVKILKDNLVTQQTNALEDLKEMERRQNLCFKAIEQMLRTKLLSEIPACKNVAVERSELKTNVEARVP